MQTQHVLTESLSTLLETALRGALAAGEEILDVYGRDFDVELKDDNSPLTQADRRAQAAIVPILEAVGSRGNGAGEPVIDGVDAAGGSLPILSEEAAHAPFEQRRDWKALWVVDPLDGTKEFVKRNGEFTVNIALVANGEPLLGVVYAPFLGNLYWGVVGQGAYKVLNAKPELHSEVPLMDKLFESANAISPAQTTAGTNGVAAAVDKDVRPYTVVASRSHMSKETQEFVDKLRKHHPDLQLISAGSALKICLVAEGDADVYPRFAPTMEWDTAAGHAVAQAAGCSVDEHPAGTPLRYNKEDLLNPWFLVGSPLYNDEHRS